MVKRVAWGRVSRNFHFARDGLILEKPKYNIKVQFTPHSIDDKQHVVNIVWEIIAFIAALHKQAVSVIEGASAVKGNGAQ